MVGAGRRDRSTAVKVDGSAIRPCRRSGQGSAIMLGCGMGFHTQPECPSLMETGPAAFGRSGGDSRHWAATGFPEKDREKGTAFGFPDLLSLGSFAIRAVAGGDLAIL